MGIYKTCMMRMSAKGMSNLMYALIMTKSRITQSYGVGIYNYDRKQNAYNNVELMLYIEPEQIKKFEEISGVVLEDPIVLNVN